MKDRQKTKAARLSEEHRVEMAQELRNQQLERDQHQRQLNEQIQAKVLAEALKVTSIAFTIFTMVGIYQKSKVVWQGHRS